jgi:type I restriction enzyme S subunit
MSGWRHEPFDNVIVDESGGNLKTPQSEFLPSGRYAIVDQGKELIAGYTNDESRLCRAQLPVIVFGDHTRCFKYVDFPFCMGADGVKVLRPKVEADIKYLYHYLRELRLTDGGYDRHFKYLKRSTVALPPLPEQRRIAAILDKADELRAKRRAALAKLDSLTQSIFLDMFGDPATNPKGWNLTPLGEISEVQGGLQLSSSRKSLPREVPYLRVANVYRGLLDLGEIKTLCATESEIARTVLFKDDFLVVEGHGNPEEIGRGALWDGSISECVHQNHLIRVRFDNRRIMPLYASVYLNSTGGRRHLLRSGKTTSGLNTINVSQVRATPTAVPPVDFQRQFCRQVGIVEHLRTSHTAALVKLDSLLGSLQHRAFQGEL